MTNIPRNLGVVSESMIFKITVFFADVVLQLFLGRKVAVVLQLASCNGHVANGILQLARCKYDGTDVDASCDWHFAIC